jgi:GNAT superfamily N-acetyltransferase
MLLQYISYETIKPIWEKQLWPTRQSSIDSHSAMLSQVGIYDCDNFKLPVWFYGIFCDNSIVGVNSVHADTTGWVRSRGLYVFPEFRKSGYGLVLLKFGIKKAIDEGAAGIWSFPRKSSWSTYEAAGFKIVSDWQASETSIANAYCKIKLL